MKLNILYLYDEEEPDENFISVLEQAPDVVLVDRFSDPADGLIKIKKYQPDAILIDMDIHGLDGIAYAQNIIKKNGNTAVILISKDSTAAIDAFGIGVLDFILKPAASERVQFAVDKLMEFTKNRVDTEETQKVEVSTFGMFTVMVGDTIVRWQALKCAEIFAFLLFNNRKTGVEKLKIIKSIWDEKGADKPDVAFRSYLYRLNITLKGYNTGMIVKSLQGAYKLEYQNIEVDAFKLEEYAKSALPIEETQLQEMQDLLFAYDGEIFGGFNFKWSSTIAEKVNLNFEQLSKKLCRYYIGMKKFTEAEEVVSHYLKINKIDEEAFELKIEIKHLMGKFLEAERYYKELCELYQTEYGTEPNKRLKKYVK